MKLSDLKPIPGSRKSRKRVGRGTGSGLGTTAGYGNKGQRATSGGTKGKSFEGGQLPLTRRIPKRGFKNPFRKEYAIINIADLEVFKGMEKVGIEDIMKAGFVQEDEKWHQASLRRENRFPDKNFGSQGIEEGH